MNPDFRLEQHPIVLMRPRISFPYSWVGHIPFAYLVIDLLRPRRLVELGTDSGNSYLAFCKAVKTLGLTTRCTAVDSWQGDEHSRRYGEEVYLALRAVHDPAYATFSRLLRTRFDDALAEFADGSIDLLHIDGLHTYEAVRHDFETWLPKLSDRGVVLLHDTNVHERQFGVWKFFEEIADSYPHFEFRHGNGLGIVVVGNEAAAPFMDFLHAAQAAPDAYRAYFESLAATLVNAEDGLPVDGIAAETTAAARIYYRRSSEIFDEARMISRELPAAQGTLDLHFTLPSVASADYLRIDPIDLPGVFTISGVVLDCGDSGKPGAVEDLSRRVGRVNGDRLETESASAVRLAAFGDDPYLEFEVGDLLEHSSADAPLQVGVRIDYEAVVGDASSRRLLQVMAAAFSGIRESAAQGADLRTLARDAARSQRSTNRHLASQLQEQLSAMGSATTRLLVQSEERLREQAEQLRSDIEANSRERQASMNDALTQIRSDFATLGELLRDKFVSQANKQSEILDSMLRQLQSRLDLQSQQVDEIAQRRNEQMQQIEGRLGRLEKRNLWSLFKPNRG